MKEKEASRRIGKLELLCFSVASMPDALVALANQHGIIWAEAVRKEARRILGEEPGA